MFLRIYGVYLALLSLLTYCFYASDKLKAKNGQWRISERKLLSLSIFGGAIGGYFAMQTLRHKTKHWYFHIINILGIMWQVAVLLYLIANH
jgi:uncharacterized membrane protein YsdA (DUF1294 family)